MNNGKNYLNIYFAFEDIFSTSQSLSVNGLLTVMKILYHEVHELNTKKSLLKSSAVNEP